MSAPDRTVPSQEPPWKGAWMPTCERLGKHLFRRDYTLGVFPYGEPYCMYCGIEAWEANGLAVRREDWS